MTQPRKIIPTWVERCDIHDGLPTQSMIQARMQDEIDDLRVALEAVTQRLECINACLTTDFCNSMLSSV